MAAAAAVLTLTSAGLPGDGSPVGVGDRLFPQLGNPGYDVLNYDIAFDYHGNDKPLDAVTSIDARATDTLRRFDLDFARGNVRSVQVNGRPARYATEHEELVITPEAPVPEGSRLKVTVAHTSDPTAGTDGGWVRTPDGLAMANQADAAHRVFPCNDHPSDKARFTFHVTAPKDLTVVANGLPESARTDEHAATTTWTYRTSQLMATELAQVSIGRSAVIHRTGPHGLPLRDVVGAADRALLDRRLAMTSGQIEWMERQVGPYPFETYGILSANTNTGFELETQTLSLFERRVLLAPEPAAAPVMVHELAHQWFGDSVSPATWSDLWLNEGHATWYQVLYAVEKYGAKLDGATVDDKLANLMRGAYQGDNRVRREGGPPANPLPPDPANAKLGIFRSNVYAGGALALYALRQEIGAGPFQRLERAWVARYRDGNASTADFIALASETAGRDLSGFLRGWLYGAATPPMPGHPDWKSVAAKAKPATKHR
ncbi:M1 family metallopeptidase [Actinacidiphila oryziradicis]|uniref:M1 family metallopeptidase n=1 Tax=Actinacidiphila oryziradicis TaxID=2571141 RepID=UPI0023F480F8|nr:M1 family metallopeptidase [Actinacidiphila oryziradicis]